MRGNNINDNERGQNMSRTAAHSRGHIQPSMKLPERSYSSSLRPSQSSAKRGQSPSMRSRSQSPNSENSIARSKAEQIQFDILADCGLAKNGGGKFRQLPCRTFIATGHCPYKDRCVYLHCPSIRSPLEVSAKLLSFVACNPNETAPHPPLRENRM